MIESILSNPLVLPAVIFGISVLVGRMYTKKSNKARRESALEVAKKLRKYGLDEVPKLFEAYALGETKAMVSQLRQLSKVVRDEDRLKQELEIVFERILTEKISNPLLRKAIKHRIDAAIASEAIDERR